MVPHSTRRREPDRIARGLFIGYVAVALPLLLFGLGDYHWFFRDDWAFLAARDGGSLDGLFHPHNEHWTTVGVVVFRLLYSTVGLHSYLPYQAVVVTAHLSVVVLLRVVMRRAGVDPWIATAAATSFVLFGPGSQNILDAFQIAFTGALAFGLAHVLLVDHDGALDRRDALGVGCGALAIMCSGVGVAMVAVVGVVALFRRGLLIAAVNTVPLGVMYVVWWLVEQPLREDLFGRPSLTALIDWVISGEIGAFVAIGHFPAVAAALALLMVLGLVGVAVSTRGDRLRGRLLLPCALLGGGVLFSVISAQGRWWQGPDFARISRYVYLGAALALPAIAVGADELARRRRELLPVVIGLLVVAIPLNGTSFESKPYDGDYHRRQQEAVSAAPLLPYLADVPPDTPLFHGWTVSSFLTTGFLREASAAGKLPEADTPTATLADEIMVNVGVASAPIDEPSGDCQELASPVELEPELGATYALLSDVTIAVVRDGEASAGVTYRGDRFAPLELTIQLRGLHLIIASRGNAPTIGICGPA